MSNMSQRSRVLNLYRTAICLAVSQLVSTRPTTTEAPLQKWTGPFADHQLGIHPSDTADVAKAKAYHLTAHKDALAVLPILPPEERYIKQKLPLNENVLVLQKQAVEQIVKDQEHIQRPVVPRVYLTSSTTIPSVLAEDIPRGPTGEVLEVYAARVAHLKAVAEARAAGI
ncbi:uncharacterized protein osi isoform X1 [Euwallacea fornicatus]|uniref:uncharacterized protein osi isoform X1 n=1 Tax=Euwallacea fornicatus TaxID=995702 RepID=UPI00338E0E84